MAIEAVGMRRRCGLYPELVRPGGRVRNVGVHGHSGDAPPRAPVDRDVMITTGLVDTNTTPRAAQVDRGRSARSDRVRHAPLRARRERPRLRRVLGSGRDARAQGGARSCGTGRPAARRRGTGVGRRLGWTSSGVRDRGRLRQRRARGRAGSGPSARTSTCARPRPGSPGSALRGARPSGGCGVHGLRQWQEAGSIRSRSSPDAPQIDDGRSPALPPLAPRPV